MGFFEKLKIVNPCKPHTGHLDPRQISGTTLPSNTLLAALFCSKAIASKKQLKIVTFFGKFFFNFFVSISSFISICTCQISGDPVILIYVCTCICISICTCLCVFICVCNCVIFVFIFDLYLCFVNQQGRFLAKSLVILLSRYLSKASPKWTSVGSTISNQRFANCISLSFR